MNKTALTFALGMLLSSILIAGISYFLPHFIYPYTETIKDLPLQINSIIIP